MKRILVIGASRGIGLEVTRQALERGLTVRAMARSADKITLDSERLERVVGDATDPSDLKPALEDVDAVVLALGVPKNLDFITKPVALFSTATAALLPLMTAAGVRRLLAVTGFGAGESSERLSFVERIPFRAVMGRAYDDKTRQEDLIKASDLDWTIVRPGILTNGPHTGRYKVLTEKADWRNGIISRADVADFLLRALEDDSHVGAAPVLVR